MKTKLILTILLLAAALSVVAGEQPDPITEESDARVKHLCDIYNNDLNDSLIHQAARDLEFHKQAGCWENYYETWTHLVNTYVFMGRVNTGLKEVKQMHADATARRDLFGQAMANYAMGNAYNNMGYLDEAIDCYRKSLSFVNRLDINTSTVNYIFSYYCDALNAKKDYTQMTGVTRQWRDYLTQLQHDEPQAFEANREVWLAYYHIACAQQDLGLDQLDRAEAHIDSAATDQREGALFIPLSIMFYKAQLFLQRGDYQQALRYNTRRMEESEGYDDMSSLVLIYEQRAEIMKGLGRYQEAAEMYKDVYNLTDSIYLRDARTQITELNTLFRVDELNLEKQLQKNRLYMVLAVVVAVALAVIVLLGVIMMRRLRHKNEELAIAHDRAQESSRMKTAFIKNISHEIRTPLNILSGFSQVLTQVGASMTEEMRQDACLKIQENTDRITSLINRLLELSETTSHTHIDCNDTMAADMLCQMAIARSGVADRTTHHFTFDNQLPPDTQLVTNERYALSALGHLLDNAVKFTPAGGSITMTAQAEGHQLAISIADTGCGIPADKMETIFEEFVQLDEYKEGVGIGLALSRNIVRRMGGELVCDAHYTGGARFVVTLPLKR